MPRNKWFALSCIWLALGIYSLIFHENNANTMPPFQHFDKLSHTLLFMVQFWLLCKAYFIEHRHISYSLLWSIVFIYATLSELGQYFFTQTRTAQLSDWLADLLGASIGIYLAHFWKKKKFK